MREIATFCWDEAALPALARELLTAFPSVRLRVTGACMEPAIPEGVTVVLADARSAPPRFGDVVLAQQGPLLRLHRLVWAPSARSRRWRTQADRAALFDPGLHRDDVLATVVSVEGRQGPPRRVLRACSSLLRSLACWLRLRLLGPSG